MKQRIELIQSAYFGNCEAFLLKRSSGDGDWTVGHYFIGAPLQPGEEHYDDVTHKYNPGWLSRTIDELKILELKSQKEIALPHAQMLDGLEFSINIQSGRRRKKIYYYEYFEFLGDYPDVWRADTLWTLLKSWKEEGHGH